MRRKPPARLEAKGKLAESNLNTLLSNTLSAIEASSVGFDSEQALISNLRDQIEALNRMTFSDKEWKHLCQYYLVRPGETIVEKARRVLTPDGTLVETNMDGFSIHQIRDRSQLLRPRFPHDRSEYA